MKHAPLRLWRNNTALTSSVRFLPPSPSSRSFRSDAALEAIARASEERVPTLALYNYPSFSGAFSSLFTHVFHSHLNLPCLVLPYSSVEPLRAEDLCIEGLERLYLLDFLGPRGFAEEISRRTSCKVIGFDHRESLLRENNCPEKLEFRVNVKKSSSVIAYQYFSDKLSEIERSEGMSASLLEPNDRDRVELVLKYIENVDLRSSKLSDVRAFRIGLDEWRSKFNCLTNPYMYEQLLEINAGDLITKGNSYISAREKAAEKLLDKVFKVSLGRGFYGECLGVRADGNSQLVDEIGKILSVRSMALGLRPIGAVILVQRKNLKMCLRSTDSDTDTSEVAKAYGGGGSSSSSSFIIRMDEYNQWLSAQQSNILR